MADGGALPSRPEFNATTRTSSGAPRNDHVGAISAKVTASDGASTASDEFAIVGNQLDVAEGAKFDVDDLSKDCFLF